MSNKAIHQLPTASNRVAGDLFIIERSNVCYKLDEANMAPQLLSATTLIESADVLTLNTTPVVVVPPAPTGYVVVPMRGLIEFSGGSADYATNTTLVVGSSGFVDNAHYTLAGHLEDRTIPNALTAGAGANTSPCPEGYGLSAMVINGNPTAGNSDLTITVWYYLLSV